MNGETPKAGAPEPAALESVLRRWQIRSVAIGSSGAILFLVGLSLQIYSIAWVGLVAFVLALSMVLAFGMLAWWRFG
jgi:hypothetical protein